MHMNDCVNRGAVREHVVNYMIILGLPCRKKFKNDGVIRQILGDPGRNTKVEFKMKDLDGERVVRVYDRKIFGIALRKLGTEEVTLRTGQIIPVPPMIHDLCEHILENVDVEGIFRKAGSTSRQAHIKSKIDKKGNLTTEELDVIDVAAIVKYFLRKLPEPLIPTMYHKLFIACYNKANKDELILLAVLLLPIEHLNLITYIMQFFSEVSDYASQNKMTVYNLAVCLAPNIFQVFKFSAEEFSHYTGIVKVLIERSKLIGKITEEVRYKLNLEKDFNQVRARPLIRIFNNVLKGLNFMSC